VSVSPNQLEQLLADHFSARADTGCAREVPLEGYAAGELAAEERAQVETHLSSCDGCKAALRAYDEVDDLWSAPLSDPAPSPVERLRAWLSAPRLLVPAAAAAAAAVALFVWLPDAPDDEGLHAKGGYTLHVAVERRGHAFRLIDGARLEDGDHLGFFYTASGEINLTVLYLDDAGELVRLFPALSQESAALEAGHQVRLPDGALISPGEGCEWVIGIFSRRPVGAVEAEVAARQMWQARQGCRLGEVKLDQAEVQVLGVQR